jgi:lysophospholipase L1-like esterase
MTRGDRLRYFSAKAADGNYRVTLALGDPDSPADFSLWAGTRRLMIEDLRLPPGADERRVVAVNVRDARLARPPPKAPGGERVVLGAKERGLARWKGMLGLELSGPYPSLRSIDIERDEAMPTLFLAGDSTVADQPAGPYASWGQMLPRFLGPALAVANHAASGETLKSFLSNLRWAKILQCMKAGDYLLVQFGHNDQKAEWPQTYAPARTAFKAYLRAYVAEARDRGAVPILASPPERCRFDARGKVVPSLGAYPDAMRELAEEQGCALVDLEAMSREFYEALGPELAPMAFAVDEDRTHHGAYGAYELAKCVAFGLRGSSLPLAAQVLPEIEYFSPGRPDSLVDHPLLMPRGS